jgi:hypothetical protein
MKIRAYIVVNDTNSAGRITRLGNYSIGIKA